MYSYNAAFTYPTTISKHVKGYANYSKNFGFGQQGIPTSPFKLVQNFFFMN